MTDLYLDPNFKVEGNDFVFEAHDDNNKDYVVKVTFDDVAAFLGRTVDTIANGALKPRARELIFDTCTGLISRFQTGTTSYDVEIKRKKVQYYEFTKAIKRGKKYQCENYSCPVTNFKTKRDVSLFMMENGFAEKKIILA